jgi:hypothetical protein
MRDSESKSHLYQFLLKSKNKHNKITNLVNRDYKTFSFIYYGFVMSFSLPPLVNILIFLIKSAYHL